MKLLDPPTVSGSKLQDFARDALLNRSASTRSNGWPARTALDLAIAITAGDYDAANQSTTPDAVLQEVIAEGGAALS